jgi:hypothetical protein
MNSWLKTGKQKKLGQVSVENILILGFILILLILVLNILSFFSDNTDTKITQSKLYWSSMANPIKITAFALSKYEASDGVFLNLSATFFNPTDQKIVIRKLILSKGNFADVFDSAGNYKGKTDSLFIVLLPSTQITLNILSFQSLTDKNLYSPSRVFDLGLSIVFDSNLPSQTQIGTTNLVNYLGEATSYMGSQNIFQNGCPVGFIPCPDVAHCVPPQFCVGNQNQICIPPNIICSSNCCTPPQVCLDGTCTTSLSCEAPNRLCGPINGVYYCIGPNQICTPNGPQSCSSPNSIVCNTVCCPDNTFCSWDSSSCLGSCNQPNFVCPSGSSNCCTSPPSSYCDPNSGSCLSSCASPKITCGPDANGITYCCDGTTQICDQQTKTCQTCPTNYLACDGSICCPPNYICLDGSCFCPPERKYTINGQEMCCPQGSIYNPQTNQCEPCQTQQIGCLDKCCESNTLCDISNPPTTTCTDCCPANTFNCNNKYCCNTSSACINGMCLPSCPSTQIACPKSDGSVVCCPSNTLCGQPSGVCIPTSSCPSSQQCGTFCCEAGQFCYDGACVSSYPDPLKCNEISSTCPQERQCGTVGIDDLGNIILIPTTCCAAGEYCANETGQCCSSQICPKIRVFSTSLGDVQTSVGQCCASSTQCMPEVGQSLSNQTCCDYNSQAATYSYRTGSASEYSTTTLNFSNDCGGYCCPDGTGCIDDSPPTCCSSESICRVGNSSVGYIISCCPSGSSCAYINYTTDRTHYENLTSLCCPENRQCLISGSSTELPVTCCPEGTGCTGGNSCCPQANYCQASPLSNSLCCDSGTECIYSSSDNSAPLCCPLENIYNPIGDDYINLESYGFHSLACCSEPVMCKDKRTGQDCPAGTNPIINPTTKSISCPSGCYIACNSLCQNQQCSNSSGTFCCATDESCLQSSTNPPPGPLCCPPENISISCENGQDPPNCGNTQICCLDRRQNLTFNNQKFCCINNATDVFVACGSESSPSTKSNCCPSNLCKWLGSEFSACCGSQEDVLCQLTESNYVCCPSDRCAAYRLEFAPLVGICCPYGTSVCDRRGSSPSKLECCPFGTMCSASLDPDNPSTYCCPLNRYLRLLFLPEDPPYYAYPSDSFTCCSHTQILPTPNGAFCCPDGSDVAYSSSQGGYCCYKNGVFYCLS